MIDKVEFSEKELHIITRNSHEIDQTLNPDAYARLFVADDSSTVLKLFDGIFKIDTANGVDTITYKGNGERNLFNLQLIRKKLRVSDYPWLALPQKMIYYRGCLVGYLMPFYRGKELCFALDDESVLFDEKIEYFNKIATHLRAFPDDIFVSDLHSHNIIVQENGNVVFVDVDGFSTCDGWMLTTPLTCYSNLPKKYYKKSGELFINRNTDILCLFRMFFSFFFEGRDVLLFPKHWVEMIPLFFSKIGADIQLIEAIARLFSEDENIITDSIFSSVKNLSIRNRYQLFLEITGLVAEETKAASSIERRITTGQY